MESLQEIINDVKLDESSGQEEDQYESLEEYFLDQCRFGYPFNS
jgi:hypothetical protein